MIKFINNLFLCSFLVRNQIKNKLYKTSVENHQKYFSFKHKIWLNKNFFPHTTITE